MNVTAVLRGILVLAVVSMPMALSAQEQPEASPLTVDSVAAPAAKVFASPGKAFLRSVLVPGWGQASVGAYNRAGFYFGVEAISGWMFMKTIQTLSSAEEVLSLVEADATVRLIADGTSDLQEIAHALDDDEGVIAARDLVGVRAQQKEDWLAFGLFMLLIGGADAFVSGHLTNFPEALETGFRVTPDGAFEAGLSVKLPYH